MKMNYGSVRWNSNKYNYISIFETVTR